MGLFKYIFVLIISIQIFAVDAIQVNCPITIVNNARVLNLAPVSDAGVDQTVKAGDLVTLDGSNSFDCDGSIKFKWMQSTRKPKIVINNFDEEIATFTASNIDMIFKLKVTDDKKVVVYDKINIKISKIIEPIPPVILPPSVISQNANSPIGMNITSYDFYSKAIKSVNAMKRASDWKTGVNSPFEFDTKEQSKMLVDANGYPISLPDGSDTSIKYRLVTALIYHGINEYQPGQYIVLYDGKGVLNYRGGIKNTSLSMPGRDVVDLKANVNFMLQIVKTDTDDNGNYLRNIRIIVPGGICDNDPFYYSLDGTDCNLTYTTFEQNYKTQIFHPLYLSALRKYRALRFMQAFNTNLRDATDPIWSDRTKLSTYTWTGYGGMPIENAIDLSNILNAEPWINVPLRASDNYIKLTAQLVKSRLKSNLNLYMELGNEIWNNGYPYNLGVNWLKNQAALKWPNSTVPLFEKRLNYYGYKSANACAIWKAEFGDRVKCVIATQGGNTWTAKKTLDCSLFASETNGYKCSRDMYGLAIGPYFGHYIGTNKYYDTVSTWLSDNDKGVGKIFTELNTGILIPGGSLAQAKQRIIDNKAVADSHNIRLLAYEGGQHLTYGGNRNGNRNQINSEMFIAANHDARIGTAINNHLNDWKDADGDLYLYFEGIGGWSIYGSFPVLENMQDINTSVKYKAINDFIDNNECWWTDCKRGN